MSNSKTETSVLCVRCSCDLITEVNPWDAKTQIQLKRLKEVASQLNLTVRLSNRCRRTAQE